MSDFEYKITRDCAIARIDLNRPDEGNALTPDMASEYAGTLLALVRS